MQQIMRAIFLDRDGVLNEDIDLLHRVEDIIIPKKTIDAFLLLAKYDFLKIVISNQTVISRGLTDKSGVGKINEAINKTIFLKTGTSIDKFYICPHHPNATVLKYRKNCNCRKPKSGMFLQAAAEFGINLKESWMIGDRISDIIAGFNASCKTILIRTGKHKEPPIISDAIVLSIKPNYICINLLEAIKIIIERTQK